ncbi:MAG TPA: NAD-binding protein, partial [bacterium]
AFETVKPLLAKMGTNVILQGGPGAGQHTKVVNQIVTSTTILGIAEAMAYARRAGLDPTQVVASLSKGSAASFHLDNTAPKMIAGDTRPGFQVHHLVKDLEIASAQAQAAGLDLKALRVCLEQWKALLAGGGANLGTQAVATLYAKTP